MLEKFSNRVYYLPFDFKGEDRPILGLVVGDYSSLMIDSGISPNHAKDFMNETQGIEHPPIEQLVITHNHYDHVFGIDYLKIPTIAHTNTKIKMEAMMKETWDDAHLDKCLQEGMMSEVMVGYIKNEMPDERERVFCPIDASFEKRVEIDLGNLLLFVDHIECDHTDDSSVVYIPSEKVVFLGDCIYPGVTAGAYGYSLENVKKMTQQLKSYDATTYIVSHELPYSREKLFSLLDNIMMVGEVVEDGLDEVRALNQLEAVIGREATNEEKFFVGRFVEVNKAKKGD